MIHPAMTWNSTSFAAPPRYENISLGLAFFTFTYESIPIILRWRSNLQLEDILYKNGTSYCAINPKKKKESGIWYGNPPKKVTNNQKSIKHRGGNEKKKTIRWSQDAAGQLLPWNLPWVWSSSSVECCCASSHASSWVQTTVRWVFWKFSPPKVGFFWQKNILALLKNLWSQRDV